MGVWVNSWHTLLGFGEGRYENVVIAEGWHCMLGNTGVEAGSCAVHAEYIPFGGVRVFAA